MDAEIVSGPVESTPRKRGLIVRRGLQNLGRLNRVGVSGEYLEFLDLKLREIVERSIVRAQENGRKTLLARDL